MYTMTTTTRKDSNAINPVLFTLSQMLAEPSFKIRACSARLKSKSSPNRPQKSRTQSFSEWTAETETEAFREREAPQESSRCNRFFRLFVCVYVNAVVMKYWCSLPNCLVKSSSLFRAFHLQHLRKRRGERSWQKRWTQASGTRLSETTLPALHTDSIANFLYLSISHALCLFSLWLRCSMQGSDRW